MTSQQRSVFESSAGGANPTTASFKSQHNNVDCSIGAPVAVTTASYTIN